MASNSPPLDPCSIAIVGMAGRFPGAPGLESFWRNLCQGVDSISRFTPEELNAAGVDPRLIADPAYVPAGAVLDGVDLFDAPLFRFTPREAELLDPQHRLLLECAWEALEDAGHAQGRGSGKVGVFAGASFGQYLRLHLLPNQDGDSLDGGLQSVIANDKDFLATRVSYKLDLRGPSLDVQTACSTSLVAVWLACQSLLSYQCDLALAGGVSVRLPQRAGYLFQERGILSPDGRCRPFDASAAGTVRGSGVGLVVLRRLEDAVADGDSVRAVIRGVAVNNDGADKAGYAAPSADGQAEAVDMALALAGVEPGSITFIEGHGTATQVGDPIEVRALSRVFRADAAANAADTADRGFCALGSVKGNIGHLDAAAGVAGLIKAVLALQHRQIPPTAHFERPNPELDLAASPFYVNNRLVPWETDRLPRRAGVSSFGIGGSNAHVVLEEAPPIDPPAEAPGARLLVLSARTRTALDAVTANLAGHLRSQPGLRLADAAWTLQAGRKPLPWRRAAVVHDLAEAADRFGEAPAVEHRAGERRVAFLLPGQGARDLRAAAELYPLEPAFRDALDECRGLLAPHLGLDVGRLLLPGPGEEAEAASRLVDTALAQPALFAFEYALARLWMVWGVRPQALLGHSLGELVAACLAGVIPLPRALALVALRGRLAQSLPPGEMLAVRLPEEELAPLLPPEAALAAVNAPGQCVASGPPEAMARLRERLVAGEVEHRLLAVQRAFHSPAVEPMLAAWEEELRRAPLAPPRIPFLSNVTGTWIEPGQAQSPGYWVEHLRRTVRFADGLRELLRERGRVLLEVGPGQTLAALALRNARPGETPVAVPSLPREGDAAPAHDALLNALGRLWTAGVEVDWKTRGPGGGRRVPLPTYPFERQSYWVEARRRSEEMLDWEALERLEAGLASGTVPGLGSMPPPEVAELCTRYVCRLLRESGVELAPGRAWALAELRRRLRLQPQHEPLFRLLLRVLAEDRLALMDGESVRFLGADEVGPPEPLRERLEGKAPAFQGLYGLLDQCARQIPRVLCGEVSGLEVLYPEGRSDLLRQASREGEGGGRYEVAAALLRQVVAGAAARNGRKLRLLEVGAGEGVLTSRLAPAVAGPGIRYCVTDLGRSFVLAAEQRAAAAGWSHLEFGVLDIARDPVAQGFAPGSFDLVLGANVVHATPRIEETLAHLRTLLAPGGFLLLLESVRPQRWADLIWGLTDGWWSFEDTPLRTCSPLLSAEAWQAALLRTGFEKAAALPRSAALREASDVALLVARRAEPAGAWRSDPETQARPMRQAIHARPALLNPYAAPRDAVEQAVADIWSAALGIENVGIHDNFFELGGDSLTALQVARAMERRFGLPGGRFLLFENPSVAAAARSVSGRPEEAVDARLERGSRRRARRTAMQRASQ
ncbi:MAG TPA: beta-ketoacyl synthase N-terminal-like domain-containing protein [Thermoanaerobaculia bacterium]|nr:beta-ketoacyl synthase N-terminal-like domain-containing protein [Thermoanaerobaculia bacterium]